MKRQCSPRQGRFFPAHMTADPPRHLVARRVALEILVRVERDRAFADVLLGQRLAAFAPTDRRLITQLVLGTIAWQGRLDFELSQYCRYPLHGLAP